MFLAKVYVTLKSTVNDPQGRTIMGSLKSLGFQSVTEVRAGKYLEIWLQVAQRNQAEARIKEMCEKLLANPVIEEYQFELVEVSN